ncbi:MAG: hypothetical protein IPJ34_19725 [Myxococcales bacterium]|nr:hypothetical protein [Myxococcales bacterium]
MRTAALLVLALLGCGRPVRSPCGETGFGRLTRITAGKGFTCGLTNTHAVICWGSNADHAVGSAKGPGAQRPHRVIDDAVDVAAGWTRACAVRHDGHVLCWGFEGFDALVDESLRPGRSSPVPRAVEGLADARTISCGGFTCCAVRTNGRVACFGDNRFGQLGDGGKVTRPWAADVANLTHVVQVTATGARSCALRSDGTVWCWGLALDQGLGDGSTIDRAVPGPVPGVKHATSLGGGAQSICAVADGEVVCWGTLPSSGVDEPPRRPGSIGFLASFDPLAVESGATVESPICVRSAGGEVACLGNNLHGQLGNGTTEGERSLVRVEGLSDVTSIAVGGAHVCALRLDGELWCWGSNESGQLAAPDEQDHTRPTRVFFREAWDKPALSTCL